MWILVLFISSVLIYGLLAPLFRRSRATFSQFVEKLIFSPQSGKTFNDISTKRNPLSALTRHSPRRGKFLSRHLRATLPEGESFLSRHLRATLPEGESSYRCSAPLSIKAEGSYRHRVPLSPKGKAFLPSGKTFSLIINQNKREDFFLFDSIKTSGKTFFSSTQSKRAGRLSII